jgi:beta propeller repeat protein
MLEGKLTASSTACGSRLVILSIALACAVLACAPIAEAKVVTTQVARFTPGDQYAPDIEGSRIVYADNAPGNADIYMYDTATKVRTHIQDGPNQDTDPKISGDNVVYLSEGATSTQLLCYSISGHENRMLSTGATNVLEHAVSGDTVAYVAFNGVPYTYDVMTISLSTGATKKIATYDWTTPFGLSIAGNYLAYSFNPDTTHDDDSGLLDLTVADLSTETTRVVYNGSQPCVTARGTVIFSRSFGDDVVRPVAEYVYSTDTSSTLFSDPDRAETLDVSSGRVLYYDTNGLWVYQPVSGTRVRIATPKTLRYWANVGTARMSGTKVVWDDTRYTSTNGRVWPAGTPGNWMDYDVYSATYSTAMYTVACPKGVTYGKHATISGKVSTTSGAAYAGKVTLQRSTDKTHWTSVTTKSTSSAGNFSVTSGTVSKATYFRVKFVKGSTTDYSYYIKVMPRLIVSKPRVPSEVKAGHTTAIITGTVKPGQSKTSDLYAMGGWKRANGTWTESGLGTVVYKPVAHSGYSTYKIKVYGLIKAGKWRVRVYARNSTKGFDWGVSSYAYFTVK